MPSRIADILELSADESELIEKTGTRFNTLAEWFSETIEAVKDSELFDLLGKAAELSKESSGTVKLLGKIAEGLTKERSPQVLGWLACTLAYQKASTDQIRLFGRPASRVPFSGEIISQRIKNLALEDPSIMRSFSLTSPTSHPFIRAADDSLTLTLQVAGYEPAEIRNIIRSVRATFKSVLQDVLSGEEKEKFAPFAEWLRLDSDDQRLDDMLLAHSEFQRVELQDQAALGVEPFAIDDVYISVECGILTWTEIRDEKNDAFDEDSAPRQDLMESVLNLIGDPHFDDCLVIQGVPGCGKSTFTKQLSVRLRSEGLIPIRIPLQHLRVDANLFEGIQDVIFRFSGSSAGVRRDLLTGKAFSERILFGNAQISPYVFIFDGWDEVSLSAAEGFQERLDHLLTSIRETLLNQTRNKIRVVVTGRPSVAVGRTNFLLEKTPVLTVRPIRPNQLEQYVRLLAGALSKPAFSGDQIDSWTLGDLARYVPVLEQYSETFPEVGPLEVLGQPLLTQLAFKVMASIEGDLSSLLAPPTTLYRHLVDLTCKKGGKHPNDPSARGGGGRIEGPELRALLHGTALAITAHGSESIPKEELELRLETLELGNGAFELTKERGVTNLMISFYFVSVRARPS